MSYDSATWLAFALVLTALGGAATWVSLKRRGVGPALRWLALTMLPMAAWLTGTLRLAVEVAGDIGHWATRLVFSPSVWAGIIMAGLAVLLFGVGGAIKSRGVRGSARSATDKAVGDDAKPAVSAKKRERDAKPTDDGLDDDISDILKRHGIS